MVVFICSGRKLVYRANIVKRKEIHAFHVLFVTAASIACSGVNIITSCQMGWVCVFLFRRRARILSAVLRHVITKLYIAASVTVIGMGVHLCYVMYSYAYIYTRIQYIYVYMYILHVYYML